MTSDSAVSHPPVDVDAIERRNEDRKNGSGHSPTCIGWSADPRGNFARESCTCAVGFIEHDVDDLLSEVKRLRKAGESG